MQRKEGFFRRKGTWEHWRRGEGEKGRSGEKEKGNNGEVEIIRFSISPLFRFSIIPFLLPKKQQQSQSKGVGQGFVKYFAPSAQLASDGFFCDAELCGDFGIVFAL